MDNKVKIQGTVLSGWGSMSTSGSGVSIVKRSESLLVETWVASSNNRLFFRLGFKEVSSNNDILLTRLSAPLYPKCKDGYGFWRVGWPSTKCFEHIRLSLEGDQSLVPSRLPTNCFHFSLSFGFLNLVGNGNSLK